MTVGCHQVPLTYLYWQWSTIRYHLITYTDSWVPPSTSNDSRVPPGTLYYLYWQWSTTRYLLLTSTDCGVPPRPSTPTDSWVPPGASNFNLTVAYHQVSLTLIYWQWCLARYLSLTSGVPPGSSNDCWVLKVPLTYLLTSEYPIYLSLTYSDSGVPAGTCTFLLLTVGYDKVPRSYHYWYWGTISNL